MTVMMFPIMRIQPTRAMSRLMECRSQPRSATVEQFSPDGKSYLGLARRGC